MNEWGYGLIALLPVLLPVTLLIGFQYPSKRVMPVTLAITALLAFFVWNMTLARIAASVIQGLTTTISILWIVFGAIFLLSTLKQTGAIHIIRQGFTKVSSDRRIQVIIVVWCFGIFIDGVSNFGTSAVIVAPLLVALGFPAFAAVVMTMLIQISSTSLGTMSSSMIMSVKNNLDANTIGILFVDKDNRWNYFLQLLTNEKIITHAIINTFIPVLMVVMLTRFFGVNKSWKEGFVVLPFALFTGLTFTIPYVITGILLGSEFPCLLGGLVSMLIVLFATKQRFLFPKTTWDFSCNTLWEKKWLGTLIVEKKHVLTGRISPLSAWSPYILLSLMLFCYHALIELNLPFIDFNFLWTNILEEIGINANITSLYLSGSLLIIAALFAVITQCKSTECFRMIKGAGKDSFNMMWGASFVLVYTLPIITIYINSNINLSYISSMPIASSNLITHILGSLFPSSSHATSTLIFGSNTTSNIIFSPFHFENTNALFIPSSIMMIIIQNIVAVSATVGLFGQEAAILRKTIIPIIGYITITSIIAMFVLYGLNTNDPLLG